MEDQIPTRRLGSALALRGVSARARSTVTSADPPRPGGSPMRPLRPAATPTSGPESPEALYITALLRSGTFNPARHGLSEDDCECWQEVWRFARDYSDATGSAPPLDLVTARFPDFEVLGAQVDLDWAASELARASAERALRLRISQAVQMLSVSDLDAAISSLEDMPRPLATRRAPLALFSEETWAEEAAVDRMPVPYDTLGRATGGIAPGELWYLIARTGHGKTWELCAYAHAAARAGRKVVFLAMEMKARAVARRLHRLAAGRDLDLVADLNSRDAALRQRAVAALAGRMSGSVEIADPSHAAMNTALVRTACEDADLVVVDHMGLLKHGSARAVDDWRVMALISNVVREHTLATGTPVLGAVQANREAAVGRRPPNVAHAAQSDALGQDADVVVTMRKLSSRVRVHSLAKVRESSEVRWHSEFDPAAGVFAEISTERADTLVSIDTEDFESRFSTT